ncbi:MAG: nucleotidyltransferase domain-containing protein [Candidatus Bathyarchaeia archaeon]
MILSDLRLRDRDTLLTKEGIIFRVLGYSHPPKAWICEPLYALAAIFKSTNPKAFRAKGKRIYYKFYEDEGLRFVQQRYPHYTIFYEPLRERLVGVQHALIAKTRKPDERLRQLMGKPPKDSLLKALHKVFNLIATRSNLSDKDFGVFGSLLHGFYHPQFSDLDLIVYGGEKLGRLCETLEDLYRGGASPLRNEFESEEATKGKRWRFVNYSPKEYLWHQRRKRVYALFEDEESGRVVKTEFEPVKDWKEIYNEYSSDMRIVKRGWIKAVVRVTDDHNAPFIPSIYQIEPIKILDGPRVEHLLRIVSYVEEFRMQAKRDEEVYVEGNLEEVITPTNVFHQVTLTYGPRYYEQVLKALQT